MLPTKTLPKIIQEKFKKKIKIPTVIGTSLTSFDALIIAHVICPTAKLLVDSGYRELN